MAHTISPLELKTPFLPFLDTTKYCIDTKTSSYSVAIISPLFIS